MKAIENLSKILLVDDDEVNNFYNESVLTMELGFKGEVAVCNNGREALDYLINQEKLNQSNPNKNHTPDLIFLDINMPVMDGFEFLEEYAKLPESTKAKIVICMLTTSLNSSDERKASQFIEIKEYVNKPLDKEGISEIIEQFFGVKQQ